MAWFDSDQLMHWGSVIVDGRLSWTACAANREGARSRKAKTRLLKDVSIMLFVLCCVAVITLFLFGRPAMQQAPGGYIYQTVFKR
jgi:hypothetical protein